MADIQFPNALFGPGTFTADVLDNNGNPSTVLDAGQEFRIRCNWDIGALAAQHLGGVWKLSAYVEAIGPGVEMQVGTRSVPLTGAQSYGPEDIVVAATTLPNPPPAGDSSAYKLVTLLTHENFGAPTDVAAVVEGPVLQIL